MLQVNSKMQGIWTCIEFEFVKTELKKLKPLITCETLTGGMEP